MGLSFRQNFRTEIKLRSDDRKQGCAKIGIFVFLTVLLIAVFAFYPEALEMINDLQIPSQSAAQTEGKKNTISREQGMTAENKPGSPAQKVVTKQEISDPVIKEPAYELLDLNSLYGMTPPQLSIDPSLITGNTHLGKNAVLPDRGGWKKVYYSFNKNDRLSSMAFVPKSPLSLVEAKKKLVEMYKTDYPDKYKYENPSVVSYEELPGKISKINFYYRNSQNHSRGINEIGIFYNIGLND